MTNGEFLKRVLGDVEQAGPPYTHTFTPPVDEDGNPLPDVPALTITYATDEPIEVRETPIFPSSWDRDERADSAFDLIEPACDHPDARLLGYIHSTGTTVRSYACDTCGLRWSR